jgi:hypothetical protein
MNPFIHGINMFPVRYPAAPNITGINTTIMMNPISDCALIATPSKIVISLPFG